MRGPVRWRQREASRAVRAAEDAGLTVERIEVSTDGKISVYAARRPKEDAAPAVTKKAGGAGKLLDWD
jgi:hypothetical protein